MYNTQIGEKANDDDKPKPIYTFGFGVLKFDIMIQDGYAIQWNMNMDTCFSANSWPDLILRSK